MFSAANTSIPVQRLLGLPHHPVCVSTDGEECEPFMKDYFFLLLACFHLLVFLTILHMIKITALTLKPIKPKQTSLEYRVCGSQLMKLMERAVVAGGCVTSLSWVDADKKMGGKKATLELISFSGAQQEPAVNGEEMRSASS